jgi:hypothetical protein
MTTRLIQANTTTPHNPGTTAHVRFIRRTTSHGGEVSRYRCSYCRPYRGVVWVACRHPEQGRPGLRVAPPGATLFLRRPVCARNGHGRSGPGALRSRPLRLRLRRSRPAPTTRGSSGRWLADATGRISRQAVTRPWPDGFTMLFFPALRSCENRASRCETHLAFLW